MACPTCRCVWSATWTSKPPSVVGKRLLPTVRGSSRLQLASARTRAVASASAALNSANSSSRVAPDRVRSAEQPSALRLNCDPRRTSAGDPNSAPGDECGTPPVPFPPAARSPPNRRDFRTTSAGPRRPVAAHAIPRARLWNIGSMPRNHGSTVGIQSPLGRRMFIVAKASRRCRRSAKRRRARRPLL